MWINQLFSLLGKAKRYQTKFSCQTGCLKDKEDHRDFIYEPPPSGSADIKLPEKVSYMGFNPPIKNQGSRLNCFSYAVTTGMEILTQMRDKGRYVPLSEEFHYYQARVIAGQKSPLIDSGLAGRDALKAVQKIGIIP